MASDGVSLKLNTIKTTNGKCTSSVESKTCGPAAGVKHRLLGPRADELVGVLRCEEAVHVLRQLGALAVVAACVLADVLRRTTSDVTRE